MSGGGAKGQTSTQQVTIPPAVLAQYQSVNASAQQAAATPFQQYSTDPNAFVAPVNAEQQAGIAATNSAAGQAQPYFDAATGQLVAAQNATAPYYGAATGDLNAAQGVGAGLGAASYGALAGAGAAAAPLNAAAGANYGTAYSNAQPYNSGALGSYYGGAAAAAPLQAGASDAFTGAYDSAQPYNSGALTSYLGGLDAAQPLQSNAASNIGAAQGVGTGLGTAALGSLAAGNAASDPLQASALGQVQSSYAGAQPYNAGATAGYLGGLASSQPFNATASGDTTGAQNVGTALGAASLGTLGNATNASNPLLGQALSGIQGSAAGAAPYNAAATGAFTGALGAAAPLNAAAGAGYASSLAGAQPYQQAATGLASAGAGAVNPSTLDAASINQYLSPYLSTVLGSTSNLLNQNNQQQQAGQLGNAITSGAFGGDRAGIAAANLEQQQNLANANIYSGIANTGYNNALAAAQQQQGVGLAAGQANRTALQTAATQLQGIGQQGFEQGQTTAAAQQGLGQTEYGQLTGTGTALQGVGNQVFNQGQTAAENTAALAGQTYQQGLSAAQQQAAVGQQLSGLGLAAGAQQAQIGQNISGQYNAAAAGLQGVGQQQFAQGQTAAQNTSGIGSTLFGQGATTAAQQAAIGQNLSGLDLSAAAQQAGLGQQVFGQGQAVGSNLQNLGSTINAQGNTLGQNQAALGQQVFGQGQTLGSNVANLGQQTYSQGMGLGTAQQGLAQQDYSQGANTSAQLAALGQQQFGQGITASQQAAGLGQDIYGTGAATSGALAGLGAGAQTAALQGAGAQTAAGTLQQQTTQAGDTALYNQFLQQQSYPFQVQQFLANIAEGTGALSGSTTTSTQPGGFFSDERLKEDITPVGKTFDGQTVYSYRYKGDDRKQIGLIAQEVEKDHPKAVGLSSGFKTVDYGRATADAAEKGHFRRGGLVPANDEWTEPRRAYAYGGYSAALPGEYPADVQALLAQQAVTPYAGGLYGSSAGTSPRGGSSYVPAANLPVGHLAVAGGLGAPPNPMANAAAIANLATKGKSAADFFTKGHGGGGSGITLGPSSVNVDVDPTSNVVPFRRGGLALGGQPNDNTPSALDIPDDSPKNLSLALPGVPPKQGPSGLDEAVNIASKILPMFLKSGGRAGFGDGGDVDQTDDGPTDGAVTIPVADKIKAALALAPSLRNAVGVSGTAPPKSPTLGETASAGLPMMGLGNAVANTLGAVSPSDAKRAADLSVGIPAAMAGNAGPLTSAIEGSQSPPLGANVPVGDQIKQAYALAQRLQAAHRARPTPQPTPPVDVNPVDPQTATPQAPPPQLTPASTEPTALAPGIGTPGGPPTPNAPPTPASNPLSGIEAALGKAGHSLKDPNVLLSILSGIAAAGTAPTVHPGVALAAGLGAGAQTYLGARQQSAQIAQTQATTGEIGAQTQAIQVGSMEKLQDIAKSGAFIPQPDPNGRFQTSDGKRWSLVTSSSLGANAATGAAPTVGGAPAYNYLGNAGQKVASTAFNNYAPLASTNPAAIADSAKLQADVYDRGVKAQANLHDLDRFASSTAYNQNGLLRPDAANSLKSDIIQKYNALVHSFIPDPDEAAKATVDEAGLTANQIANKMSLGTAAMRDAEAGQRSMLAMRAYQTMTANPNMTREAALGLISDMRIDNQMDVDKMNYLNEFGNAAQAGGAPTNRSYLAQDALQAFSADHDATSYQRDRNGLYSIMASPGFPQLEAGLQSTDPKVKQQAIDAIDGHLGKGFHRYFTGTF